MRTISRRNLLQLAGAGLAGSAMAPLLRRAGAAPGQPRRKLVIVTAPGGWDVTYGLDPKPYQPGGPVDAPPPAHGSAVEVAGHRFFEPSLSAVQESGLYQSADATFQYATEFFARYGYMSAAVRGLRIRSVGHPAARRHLLTGSPNGSERADVGALVARAHGGDKALPYLLLSPMGFGGEYEHLVGRLGDSRQLASLLDPSLAFGGAPAPLAPEDRSAIGEVVARRAQRLQETRAARGTNRRRLSQLLESNARADELLALGNFVGTPTGDLSEDTLAAIASYALESNISQVVSIAQDLGWDTHTGNRIQAGLHYRLFSLLLRLGYALEQSGQLQDTVVLVVSEFARTARYNRSTDPGKDHWPVTSALVFGGGVAPGQFGGSDDRLNALPVDLATGAVDSQGDDLAAESLLKAVLDLCGVSAPDHFQDVGALSAVCAEPA